MAMARLRIIHTSQTRSRATTKAFAKAGAAVEMADPQGPAPSVRISTSTKTPPRSEADEMRDRLTTHRAARSGTPSATVRADPVPAVNWSPAPKADPPVGHVIFSGALP